MNWRRGINRLFGGALVGAIIAVVVIAAVVGVDGADNSIANLEPLELKVLNQFLKYVIPFFVLWYGLLGFANDENDGKR